MKETKKEKWWKTYETQIIFFVGLLGIFTIPSLFTQNWFPLFTQNWFQHFASFTNSGQIGDTIGGTTAPFIGLLSAVLVYRALQAQIKANEIITKQFQIEHLEKGIENLYRFLDKSINTFSFDALPPSDLLSEKEKEAEIFGNQDFIDKFYIHLATNEPDDSTENMIKYYNSTYYYSERDDPDGGTWLAHRPELLTGETAVDHLILQIVCKSHENEEVIGGHNAVQELIKILETFNQLLDRIEACEKKIYSTELYKENKHAYRLLLEKRFKYGIAKTFFSCNLEKREECGDCGEPHGLPNDLCKFFSDIQRKLRIETTHSIGGITK